MEERFQWANFWVRSDLNYGSNCVFLGKVHFYVDTKRSVPRPKPSKEDIKQNTRVLFSAINTRGIVNFVPELSLVDYEKEKDDVMDPYYNFVLSALEVIDDYYDEIKDDYLVMDNVLMEKREEIEDRIKSCGYGCVFLPSFSFDLNPVENLWPAVKRMFKRDQLVEFENLSSRIAEACNEIPATELRGLCEYSYFKLANCLNRKPF